MRGCFGSRKFVRPACSDARKPSERAISSFIDIHPHYSRFPHRLIWDHDMFLDETPELPCDIVRLIRFRRDLRKAIFLLARPSAFPSATLTLWCANFSRTVFTIRTHYLFAYSCSAEENLSSTFFFHATRCTHVFSSVLGVAVALTLTYSQPSCGGASGYVCFLFIQMVYGVSHLQSDLHGLNDDRFGRRLYMDPQHMYLGPQATPPLHKALTKHCSRHYNSTWAKPLLPISINSTISLLPCSS